MASTPREPRKPTPVWRSIIEIAFIPHYLFEVSVSGLMISPTPLFMGL
jgi:hypothetical protein